MKISLLHKTLKRFYYLFIPSFLRGFLKPLYFSIIDYRPLNRSIQQQINLIFDDDEPVLIYLPVLEWGGFFQRPHHLLSAFARKGLKCVFCTPSLNYKEKGFRKIQDNLYLCDNPRYFSKIKNPIICISSVYCYKYLKFFKHFFLFYDVLDDLSVFGDNISYMKKVHNRLIQEADLLVTVSPQLYNELKPYRRDTLLVTNGVAFHDFSPPYYLPHDISSLASQQKPIIGFYGLLGKWLDYDLINYLVKNASDLNFVIIGDGPFQSKLHQSPNLLYLGWKAYSELKNYLYYFTVCFIPFKNDIIAEAASPLKLFEFLAMGKPVVIPNISSWKTYFGTIPSSSYEHFLQNIYNVISLSKNKNFIKQCKAVAREQSWEKKANIILEKIQQHLR